MKPIALCTLNGRYHHCAFGLRYLAANLGELAERASLLEFTINQNPREIVEAILEQDPKVVGLGVYLIAGLPGENWESFADGFDAVASLSPHEIQVGILKRLKGTPIIRHDGEWEMVYQEDPPFQVLQTKTMSFQTLARIGRFSKFWDLVANSGNFERTMGLLRASGRHEGSLYRQFDELACFLSERHPQAHGVALVNLVESLWVFLAQRIGIEVEQVREALIEDYTGRVKRDVPAFLRQGERAPSETKTPSPRAATPSRQLRHLAAN